MSDELELKPKDEREEKIYSRAWQLGKRIGFWKGIAIGAGTILLMQYIDYYRGSGLFRKYALKQQTASVQTSETKLERIMGNYKIPEEIEVLRNIPFDEYNDTCELIQDRMTNQLQAYSEGGTNSLDTANYCFKLLEKEMIRIRHKWKRD